MRKIKVGGRGRHRARASNGQDVPDFNDGREFDALSDEQKAAVFRSLERGIPPDEVRDLDADERTRWSGIQKAMKKNRGRPKVGNGVKVISLSVEQGLLGRADAFAAKLGLTRAQLVARGLEMVMG